MELQAAVLAAKGEGPSDEEIEASLNDPSVPRSVKDLIVEMKSELEFRKRLTKALSEVEEFLKKSAPLPRPCGVEARFYA